MEAFQNYPPQQQPLGLSYGIEADILSSLSEITTPTDRDFVEAVESAYCLVYPKKLVKARIKELVKAVSDRVVSIQKKGSQESTPTTPAAKSFGTSFADWLSELPPSEACLYLADNDLDKALKLYWKEDISLVQVMLQAKSAHDHQKILVQMEACMYGFGGKYSDDQGTEGNTVDINSSEGQQALKDFGF